MVKIFSKLSLSFCGLVVTVFTLIDIQNEFPSLSLTILPPRQVKLDWCLDVLPGSLTPLSLGCSLFPKFEIFCEHNSGDEKLMTKWETKCRVKLSCPLFKKLIVTWGKT